MKSWSMIILLAFLTFTALPGIAAVFGWKLTSTNVMVNEEEPHSHSTFVLSEKTLPETLNVYDYLKLFEPSFEERSFVPTDDSFHLSPLLTVFSPPPEA